MLCFCENMIFYGHYLLACLSLMDDRQSFGTFRSLKIVCVALKIVAFVLIDNLSLRKILIIEHSSHPSFWQVSTSFFSFFTRCYLIFCRILQQLKGFYTIMRYFRLWFKLYNLGWVGTPSITLRFGNIRYIPKNVVFC